MPKKKNIKKLVLQSQYVVEDYNEVNEKMSEYKEEFYKAFPEEYKKMIESRSNDNTPISGSVSEPEPESEDEEHGQEIKEEHAQSATMKMLYRRITKITHPDKVESEFLTSYFKRASTAYSESDISELFTIATTLNIDISDIDSEDIALELENSIRVKGFETAMVKGSLAWAWAMAETEEQKQRVRDRLAEHIKNNY
tara:strand:+ start:312 stop:902 length:591 start_codon:yes stop_codon:yes gene_type:complete